MYARNSVQGKRQYDFFMQTVDISTTQNVGIQFELAGLGDRIVALIIDSIILWGYMIGMMLLLDWLDMDNTWMIVSVMLVPFFYHLFCEVFFNGQSIGKRQMKIRVVRLDGNPATLGAYVLRWILRFIEVSLLMGAPAIICIAVTDNGQRLGDMAAGTTVVKTSPNMSATSHSIVRNMEESYEPVFPQVVQLSAADIQLIEQSLKAYKTNAVSKPVVTVTEKVKDHLKIESELPPVKLLYTILKDYNHLTSR